MSPSTTRAKRRAERSAKTTEPVRTARRKAPYGGLVSTLDTLERAGRTMTMVTLWLLLAATVGGMVIPTPKAPKIPKPSQFHAISAPEAPVRLVVPSLHIDAPIVPIGVGADATLTPPSNFKDVGWWDGSAKVGSASGQTVITGHTVHTGGGEMDNLGAIQTGAVVKVVTRTAVFWYRETQVIVYSKAQLTRHAEDLFSQKRKHNRLVLITCTGWTGEFYTSNVVVFAQPLGVRNQTHRPSQNRSGTTTAAG